MSTERRARRPRSKPRIDGIGEERASSVKETVKTHKPLPGANGTPPTGPDGMPMIEIFAQSSETVPVAQYANVVLGPVGVRRWIAHTDDPEEIRGAFRELMDVVEQVISEDRQLVAESVAHHNAQLEAEEASKSRRSK